MYGLANVPLHQAATAREFKQRVPQKAVVSLPAAAVVSVSCCCDLWKASQQSKHLDLLGLLQLARCPPDNFQVAVRVCVRPCIRVDSPAPTDFSSAWWNPSFRFRYPQQLPEGGQDWLLDHTTVLGQQAPHSQKWLMTAGQLASLHHTNKALPVTFKPPPAVDTDLPASLAPLHWASRS